MHVFHLEVYLLRIPSSEVACLIRTRSSNVDFLTRGENDGFGVKLRRVEMLAGAAPRRML